MDRETVLEIERYQYLGIRNLVRLIYIIFGLGCFSTIFIAVKMSEQEVSGAEIGSFVGYMVGALISVLLVAFVSILLVNVSRDLWWIRKTLTEISSQTKPPQSS